MLAVHCLVKGVVQGVGFRFFVQREARRLALSGWVRNLPGGEVEVEATGESDALKSLVVSLEKGPALARVDHVAVDWREGEASIKGGGGWDYYVF
jgi:acylphosphatase